MERALIRLDVLYGECTIMRAVCSHVSLGVIVVVGYSACAPSREEVSVQQHASTMSMVLSLKSSLIWKIACLYGVSIPVWKWRATVVHALQDHMRHVLQHSHGRTTHAYKGASHLATLEIASQHNVVQRCANVRETQCNNLNRQVLPLNFEHVQKSEASSDATILSHKTNAMHRATEATGRTNCKIYDRNCFKAVGSQLWKGLTMLPFILRTIATVFQPNILKLTEWPQMILKHEGYIKYLTRRPKFSSVVLYDKKLLKEIKA